MGGLAGAKPAQHVPLSTAVALILTFNCLLHGRLLL